MSATAEKRRRKEEDTAEAQESPDVSEQFGGRVPQCGDSCFWWGATGIGENATLKPYPAVILELGHMPGTAHLNVNKPGLIRWYRTVAYSPVPKIGYWTWEL